MPNIDRRTALASLAVAGLATACTSSGTGGGHRTEAPTADPQLGDLADERSLLALYDATIAAHPDLRARLTPLRGHHAQHVDALQKLVPAAARQSPAAGASAATTPGGPGVPAAPAAALAALRAAEHAAAGARARACQSARADRAPLLGSIAACEASHEVLLT